MNLAALARVVLLLACAHLTRSQTRSTLPATTTDQPTTTPESTTTTEAPTTTGTTTTVEPDTTTVDATTTTASSKNYCGLKLGYGNDDQSLSGVDDGCASPINIPYDIPFANKTFRSIYVCVNGLVCFDTAYDGYFVPRNGMRLSKADGHYCVAPFMVDLTTVDTGKVWYHVYDLAQDCSLANNDAVVKTRSLVRENYNAGYDPALVLAVTWDALSAYEAQASDTATFQLIFTTDGEKSYSFFFYGENKMKIMSGFAFIGQIINSLATGFQDDSTDGSYLRRPDNNLKWKNCYGAAVIRYEQVLATNYGVKCRKWHACESFNTVTYQIQFNGMPVCPCSVNQGLNDPNFDFGTRVYKGSSFTVNLINNPQVAPYSKTCGYSGTTNSFVGQGKNRGSFTKYNPITNPTSYASEDLYYKDVCCERTNLCSLFFAVRPQSSICNSQAGSFQFGFINGDPHFTTLDGLAYTFNGHGEYILLAFPDDKIDIQARAEPYITETGSFKNATVFTAFVMKGPDFWMQIELTSDRSSLQIYAGQNKSDSFNADYTLDYYTDGDNFRKSFTKFTMSRYNQTLQIKIAAGILFNVTHSTGLLQFGLGITSSFRSKATGLLGNFNGNPDDDLKPRNSNTPLDPKSNEGTIFVSFGQTWAISAAESQFRYKTGKSQATYSFPDFRPLFYENISQVQLDAASTFCGTNPRKQCIYDYVVTGNQALSTGTSVFLDGAFTIIKIADNQIPTLIITSGVRTVNGHYYVDARIGTPVYFVVVANDTGPVSINMTSDTASARLTQNSNGSVTVNLTLANSTPVDISFVGTDEEGASSSIIDVTVVACTGCSSHGTCDYTRFQQVVNQQDNFELALCVCEPYWEGADCSADVNGCAVSACAVGQNCTDRPALEHKANSSLTPYTCSSCPTGFKINNLKCEDIDECTPNNPCVGGTCTNTEGSFKCACPSGYRLDTDRVTCKDINECDESSHTCDQICTNIAPGFRCTCYNGYKRNAANSACISDTNNPVAVCQNSQCANATGCTEVNGAAQCFCQEGYSLQSNNTCTNKNECLLGVCSQGCTDTVGSFTCSCYTGYMLNVDRVTCNPCPFPTYGLKCASRCQCGRGSTGCSPIYGCVCAPGWTGVDCDTDINECLDANACGDPRKVCRNNDGSFSCSCHDGYQLVNGTCADIDECADSDLNRCEQSCSNTVGGFTCSCLTGYVTDAIDDTQCNDIDECALKMSGCEQICVNLDGRYNCECNQGFELNTDRRTCAKVASEDPCASLATKNCSDICTAVNGTAVCQCRSGYRLGADQQTCIDINECTDPNTSLNGCSDKTSCVNSAGSYVCSCAPGLELENDLRTCKACDKFHWGVNCGNSCDCGVGATTCNAVTGCVCGQGWTGDKCDADKNECEGNPCTANNEECVNTPGSYECRCQTGYERDGTGNCVNINECSSLTLNQCSQTCTDTAGSYICSCNPGFVKNGTNCLDINECSGQHGCQQLCVNTEGSYRCSCQAGFFLNDDKKTCRAGTACTSNPCSGSYVCANINGTDTCICNAGYKFDTGSITICIDIKECDSNSTNLCTQACTEKAGGYTCSCNQDGYKLDSDLATCIACEEGTYGDDCLQNCLCETANNNTKSCNKVNGTCTCWDGWTGTRCQSNVDECSVLSDPCPSNSACVDTQGSYSCVCSIGFIKLADGTCSECDSTHYGFGCSKSCTCVSANTADCSNVDGKCTCLPGWTGTDCSTNINECLTPNKCNDSLKTCSDTVGSYTCSCITGYTINNQHVCIDNDECLLGTHTCSGTGQMCKNTPGGFTCVCQPGYSGNGATCVACSSNKWGNQCLNTCTCAVNNTQQCNTVDGSCLCKPGWTGANCSQDIDECTAGTHSCTANTTCTNTQGAYTCPCALGFHGNNSNCVACSSTTWGNQCVNTCSCVVNNTQQCNAVNGSCVCKQGWTGVSCSQDIDECTAGTHNCTSTSTCINIPGGYNCPCATGYKSSINSCVACDNNTYGNSCSGSCDCVSANVISPSQMCNHVTGTCQCKVTWKGDKCQTDVDECENSTLCKDKANRGCHNTLGGFSCSCFVGYTADNITGHCVASGVTTTVAPVPQGEIGIDLSLKLNFSIVQYSKSHNLTVKLTNDEYKEEVRKGLTTYFSKEMEVISFKRVIVRWIIQGSVIANTTVFITETDAARKDFSQAVYDLLRGGIVPVYNQNTAVQEMTVGNTVVDPTTATQTSLTCLAYVEARGVCQINEECVINNGQPTCQLRTKSDDFALIVGLGVGIPLFFVVVLVIAVIVVYVFRSKKRGSSDTRSVDRTSFERGFFPVGIPTKINTHGGNDPIYVPYSWDHESSASFTSSSDADSKKRRRKRRGEAFSNIQEDYVYDNNANDEAHHFSWDFLYNYLGPNEKYEIQRPHVDRRY